MSEQSGDFTKFEIEAETRHREQAEARSLILNLGDDIATNEPPIPRQIVPDILPCASTILAAPGHEGKSVTLLFLLIRIALGLTLFGRDCRQGKVLLLFGEDSLNDVRRLVHYIVRRAYPEQNMSKRLNENFKLIGAASEPHRKLLREIDGAWYPGEWFSTIERIVENQDFSVVAVDTLSSLGLPESQGMNDAAAAYHLAANRIAERYNLAFVGSHHVGQTAAQNRDIGMYSARGATALVDNARCLIQLQNHRPNDPYPCPFNPVDRYVTRLHVVKHKWSSLKKDTPLWIEGNHYRCTDHPELTGAKLAEAQRQSKSDRRDEKTEARFEAIEAAIDECQRRDVLLTKGNIADFCTLGVNQCCSGLDQMVAVGRLVADKQTSGAGRPPVVYRRKRGLEA